MIWDAAHYRGLRVALCDVGGADVLSEGGMTNVGTIRTESLTIWRFSARY